MTPDQTESCKLILATMSNSDLIQVSHEINEPILQENALVNKLIPKGVIYTLVIIPLNALIRIELTKRLEMLNTAALTETIRNSAL